jgi:hypothetical protein
LRYFKNGTYVDGSIYLCGERVNRKWEERVYATFAQTRQNGYYTASAENFVLLWRLSGHIFQDARN